MLSSCPDFVYREGIRHTGNSIWNFLEILEENTRMKEVTMTGLTNEQVQQRIEEGKVNANENPNTRSYKQIVRENVLTFFNFLNLALMVMVLLVGSYKNSMFMGIIVINTVIGIIQEVRAKKTLDKLAILTESKAVVLREGKKWTISTEKLVLDDILFLKTGDQVPADAKVLEGSIEVNESLLTGESDNLQKIEGDELFFRKLCHIRRGMLPGNPCWQGQLRLPDHQRSQGIQASQFGTA